MKMRRNKNTTSMNGKSYLVEWYWFVIIANAGFVYFLREDLPTVAQSAAKVLGYDEDSWHVDNAANKFDWEELSPIQVKAANYLGYNEKTWNQEKEEDEKEDEEEEQEYYEYDW